MDIKTFELEAKRRGNYHDNRPAARAYWSTCWGLGSHSQLWAYQNYFLGNMEYVTGKVLLRHGSYTDTVYKIDGEHVSKRTFYAALESFHAPEVSADEQHYIDTMEGAARAKAYHRRFCTRRRQTSSIEGPGLFDAIPS